MEFFDKLWEWAPEVFPFLIKASVVTLQVTAGSLALALVLGIFVAVARISSFKLLSYPALIYTDVMRGTPALVQLFIIYFGLSDLGLEFDPISAAIIGLGLNGAAYVGEIYRAGIVAIHRGQIEAALSLGMTPVRAMRYIILPQAVRIVLPPLTNYAILLVKDTAIISTIAAPEIMFEARRIVQATFMHSVSGQIYLMAALIYMAITLPMSYVAKRMEMAKAAWH
ncbi:MAG TPA: amino acid ABC transporter permease [Gammaproteobacteria bacterium]|nr:amino acid ABC transporter permease [Gammaproteobacteria bacterium]